MPKIVYLVGPLITMSDCYSRFIGRFTLCDYSRTACPKLPRDYNILIKTGRVTDDNRICSRTPLVLFFECDSGEPPFDMTTKFIPTILLHYPFIFNLKRHLPANFTFLGTPPPEFFLLIK